MTTSSVSKKLRRAKPRLTPNERPTSSQHCLYRSLRQWETPLPNRLAA
jgi:hypothetical protein